jgi:predicted RNA-binding Zn ribbon-like protein
MSSQLPPAIFIAGSLGIDFLNSRAIPVDSVVDWIADGEGLLDWLRQAGILTSSDILTIKSNFRPTELEEAVRRARELREWFRDFVKTHKGKSLSSRALVKLKPLNDLLGLDQAFWSIIPAASSGKNGGSLPGSFELRRQRHWRTLESLLAPLAEEIARVICGADFTFIKACQGKNCVLSFYDETPRRKRRWCSMAVCGNREKQRAYRERSDK